MSLNYEVKEYRCVNYGDVDNLINKEFDFDEEYEVLAAEEWDNDSYRLIVVDGKLSEWGEKYVKEMIQTRKWGTYRTRHLLDYLCSQGKLEAGEYLIDVSW